MRHFVTLQKWVSMAVLLCLMVGIGGVAAQSGEALDLPADLYVLTNEGVVQRFGIGAAGVQVVTPDDAYVLDFGIDAVYGIIAYRTEAGLFSVPIDGSSAPTAIDANAGFPAYRGHGRTIAYAPPNDIFPNTTALVYTTEGSLRAVFNARSGGVPIFQDFTETGAFTDLSWSLNARFFAAGTDDNVWWVYRREGQALILTSVITSSVGIAWVSNSEIVFAPVEGGLKIMNLDLANQQTDLLDASYEYRLPYLTQDDQLVFFGRAKDSADVPSGYGSLIRLARGAAQVSNVGQTPIELTGLRWSPGGFLMTAFQAGVLAVFDPITGFGFPLPIENTVAYEWGAYVPPELRPTPVSDQPSVDATLPPLDTTPNEGGEGGEIDATPVPLGTAVGMALPAAAFFIAPNNWGLDQVWRLPSDGSAPVVATYEDFDVTEYAIAPNRSDVSYIANGQVWLATPQFPYGVVVARLRTFAPATPIFSPDGTRIIYAEKETGIYIINPRATNEEVAAERLIANSASENNPSLFYEYSRPQYSPQGDQLLVGVAVTDANDLEGGGFALGVYDFETQQIFQTLPFPRTDPRTANARWLLDGRIVAHSDANALPNIEPGFYVFDFIGAAATPTLAFSLPADRVVRAEREISAGVMRVLLADISNPNAPLEVVDYTLADGNARTITRFDPIIGTPRFSADGQWLIGFHLVEGSLDRGAPLLINAQTGAATVITYPNGTNINARNLSF